MPLLVRVKITGTEALLGRFFCPIIVSSKQDKSSNPLCDTNKIFSCPKGHVSIRHPRPDLCLARQKAVHAQVLCFLPMSHYRCEFVRLPQVKEMTCLSKSSIYRLMDAGDFPKQILLGARSVVWVRSQVEDWCSHKVSAALG